jgi:hypothetical protein
MEIEKKQIDFLIEKFNNSKGKNNLKKIEDEKSKLIYYNLFFDSYQEMILNHEKFIFLNDINIHLDLEINTFMVYCNQDNNKKIIFETPHYSVINYDFPYADCKLLNLR